METTRPARSPLVRLAFIALIFSLLAGAGISLAGAHGGFNFFGMGHQAHAAIGQLIQDLNLNDQQQEKLGELHHSMMAGMGGNHQAHIHHLQQFLQRVESGYVDPTEARATVDRHLEDMRHNLYQLVDGMTGLINSLDEEQRQVLEDHLRHALEYLEEDAHQAGKHGKKKHGH